MAQPGTTGVAQLDSLRKIVLAEMKFTEEQAAPMAKLVRSHTMPLNQGLVFRMPYVGAIDASPLQDNVEFDSPSQILDEHVDFTPSEVGVQVLWTRFAQDIVTENLPRIIAQLLNGAMDYALDTDLLSVFDSFGGTFGAAGVACTHELIAAAVLAVREGRNVAGTSGAVAGRIGMRPTGDPPNGQKIMWVLHIRNFYDLGVQYGGLANSGAAIGAGSKQDYPSRGATDYDARWREMYQSNISIYGATGYIDNNLTIDALDDVKGGVFSEEAIQLIKHGGMQQYQVPTKDGRAIRQTFWRRYGFGIYNDGWGREIYCDASPATG